jgi:hypothetical protein
MLWMDFVLAAIQQMPKFLSALVLLGLAWFVGNRFTVQWNLRQKDRELDLAATRDFESTYGDFFATWKLWNCYVRDVGADSLPGSSRWELLMRATDAEGRLEALLVRVASTTDLKDAEIEKLGPYRQLYQRLREAIRANVPLEWGASSNPEYVQFKALAPQLAFVIRRGGAPLKAPAGSAAALKQITDNRFELPRSR